MREASRRASVTHMACEEAGVGCTMSDEAARTSTMPRIPPGEVLEQRRGLPGELFGGRQAWRPRSELHAESETTRSIKADVLAVLFLCYQVSGLIFLPLAI